MKKNLNIDCLYIFKYKLVYDRDTSIHFLALNTTMQFGERIKPVSAARLYKPAPRRPVQKWISSYIFFIELYEGLFRPKCELLYVSMKTFELGKENDLVVDNKK